MTTLAAAPVSALLAWTLVAAPLAATLGQTTTFTLTATNLDVIGQLGCVEVVLPTTWRSVSVGAATSATGNDDWVTAATGTTVVARSTSGGDRLETGESVTFTIAARPTTAGTHLWLTHAHQLHDCTGAEEAGVPLAIVVEPGLLATPTPTPTLTQTPVPTPTPTPLPTPVSSRTPAPTPKPTATSTATPTPTPITSRIAGPTPSGSAAPTPTTAQLPGGGAPRPGATSAASASGVVRPSASTAGLGPGGEAGPSTVRASVGMRVPTAAGEVGISVGGLGALHGVEIWIVPAATIGVPGLLLLIWVALQAVGTVAWVPAVRRLEGRDGAGPGTDAPGEWDERTVA